MIFQRVHLVHQCTTILIGLYTSQGLIVYSLFTGFWYEHNIAFILPLCHSSIIITLLLVSFCLTWVNPYSVFCCG